MWSDDATGPEHAIARNEKITIEFSGWVKDTCRPVILDLAPVNLDYICPESVTLQLVSLAGVPKIIRRDDAEPYVRSPATRDVHLLDHDLPRFPLDTTKVVDVYKNTVLEIVLNRQTMLIKSTKTPGTTRLPNLIGILEIGAGYVGLLEYIELEYPDLGVLLSDIHNVSAERRHKWAAQVEETLRYLHSIGVVWGDAKVDSVVIDKNDEAWLIDFGGRCTDGWVDQELSGTKEGDLQGLEKIQKMLREEQAYPERTRKISGSDGYRTNLA